MKKTLILLASLWIVSALVGAWTPWCAQHLTGMAAMLVIGVVVFGVFRLLERIICSRRRAVSGVRRLVATHEMKELWSARPLILFFLALLAGNGWLMVSAGYQSLAISAGGYYLVLLVLGYSLSRWGNSKQYVSVLTAILMLSISAALQIVRFLSDPSAQFQYGPEIVIFAASQFAGRMALLPLDSVVIWGAWLIGEITRKSFNQPSEATSDLAQGADSSAHQDQRYG